MNTIVIPTAQNIELEYPLAGLGERILAFLIDLTLIGLYSWFLAILGIYSRQPEIIATFMIPPMLYTVLCESFFNGQTLGKRILKIRVISLDGASPTFSQYLIRWMLRLVDLYLLSGAIAIISIALSKNGQRLGDMAAGTTVIRLKLVTHFSDTIYIETAADYQIQFPQIRTLSDRDISILKEVLDAGVRSANPDLLHRLAEKVKSVAGITSDLPPQTFLETIMQDYNHLYSGE